MLYSTPKVCKYSHIPPYKFVYRRERLRYAFYLSCRAEAIELLSPLMSMVHCTHSVYMKVVYALVTNKLECWQGLLNDLKMLICEVVICVSDGLDEKSNGDILVTNWLRTGVCSYR